MNNTNRPILGVLGGLGPMATAHFMELVIRMTQAETDQEHLDMVVCSTPSTPDRTAYLLGKSTESPLPKLLEAGQKLCAAGVSCIAVPCVTAHNFLPELEAQLGVSVLDGVRETASRLARKGVTKAGILATDGTIATGLFHRELEHALITPIVPSPDAQKAVMDLIYRDIKAGLAPDPVCFRSACASLLDQGAEALILGCTELSLINGHLPMDGPFIDVLEVLAALSIEACGSKVREEYK